MTIACTSRKRTNKNDLCAGHYACSLYVGQSHYVLGLPAKLSVHLLCVCTPARLCIHCKSEGISFQLGERINYDIKWPDKLITFW